MIGAEGGGFVTKFGLWDRVQKLPCHVLVLPTLR
jgi:hypothetical protein